MGVGVCNLCFLVVAPRRSSVRNVYWTSSLQKERRKEEEKQRYQSMLRWTAYNDIEILKLGVSSGKDIQMCVCVCSLVKTKDSPFRRKRSLSSDFTVIVFRVCSPSMLISLPIPYCLAFYPPIVFYALLSPYNSHVTDSLHSAKQLDFAWMSRDVWDADLASPIRSRSTKRFWMAVKGIVRILWPGSLQISAQTPRILYIYICCLFFCQRDCP